MTVTKNAFDRLISRLDITEEKKLFKLKDISIESSKKKIRSKDWEKRQYPRTVGKPWVT